MPKVDLSTLSDVCSSCNDVFDLSGEESSVGMQATLSNPKISSRMRATGV